MGLNRTRAFVIAAVPFKEQDKLVHLLTRDAGILKAIAPGAKKHNNRFGGLLELFSEGDFQYHRRENRELATLSGGDLVAGHFHLVSQPENMFTFHLMAEILIHIVPPQQKDERLFRLIHALMEAVSGGAPVTLLLLYFQIWVLRIEGLMFTPGVCNNCGKGGLDRAWVRQDFRGVICVRCHDREPVSLTGDEIGFIEWTRQHPPSKVNPWQQRIESRKLIRLLLNKIENHTEKALKSARYIQALR